MTEDRHLCLLAGGGVGLIRFLSSEGVGVGVVEGCGLLNKVDQKTCRRYVHNLVSEPQPIPPTPLQTSTAIVGGLPVILSSSAGAGVGVNTALPTTTRRGRRGTGSRNSILTVSPLDHPPLPPVTHNINISEEYQRGIQHKNDLLILNSTLVYDFPQINAVITTVDNVLSGMISDCSVSQTLDLMDIDCLGDREFLSVIDQFSDDFYDHHH